MFKVYSTVNELPAAWDNMLKDNFFLNRNSLINLAILNSSHQSYHINEEDRIAFVGYKIDLNLVTLSKKLSIKVPVNIIGIPLSVSMCGYFAENEEARFKLSNYIRSLEGLYIILNSEHHIGLPKRTMLPECIMEIEWRTREEYISSLRSNYRYRIKKAIKKSSEIQVEELKNNCAFDQEMYKLYEEVYNNSKARLEKLDIKFFKNYPSKIFKFTLEGKPVAFIQLMENKDELIYLFDGFRHDLNRQYDLYMNMLLKVIDYGIENGFKYINFGQTSEETKLKLGAQCHERYMYVYHKNPLINLIVNVFLKGFSYKEYNVIHRAFKQKV